MIDQNRDNRNVEFSESNSHNSEPLGDGLGWASRITGVALMMVLPGIGGTWLDERLGTGFWGPLGFILGMTGSLTWLVQLANQNVKKIKKKSPPSGS